MEGLPRWYRPEKKEQRELFRASIGFDIIFVKNEKGEKIPYCVEINGENTGISGFASIPDDETDPTLRHIVETRARFNEEHTRRLVIANEVLDDLEKGFFDASDEAKKKIWGYLRRGIDKHQLIKMAFENPTLIEEVANNKARQEEFIPSVARPRTYKKGESKESATGHWIIKPRRGLGGAGVQILSNEEFAHLSEEQEMTIDTLCVVQELLPAAGADLAEERLKDSPASLRLLMDFQYCEDGAIKPVFEAAYQRVAKDPVGDTPREESHVVNKSTGAFSRRASEREQKMAHDLAIEIIHNLAKKIREEKQETDPFKTVLVQALRRQNANTGKLDWVIELVGGLPEENRDDI